MAEVAHAGQMFHFFAGEPPRPGGEHLTSVRYRLLVMGPGSHAGQTLISRCDVNAVTYTGTTGTGQRVIAAAAESFAKVHIEMGGKNPLVVLTEADLAVAVDVAMQRFFFSTGQSCTGSSHLIVKKICRRVLSTP